MFVHNGTGKLTSVLMSKPEYLSNPAPINEIAKKWQVEPLDIEKMKEEHSRLMDLYEKEGITVHLLPADKEMPNGVFARDFGGCVREGYILGNFSKNIRFKEKEAYRKKMEELGVPLLGEVKTGHFEGGDFAFIDEKTIALGMVDRTDTEGVQEIRDILEPYGYKVYGVPCKKEYLHLDMCFNLITPTIAVGYREGLPDDFLELLKEKDITIIGGGEKEVFLHGYNVQSIGENRVVSLVKNVALNQKLKDSGVKVLEIDISEVLKAGGGPHCMTFPLKRE
ncbi:dimethylarginine dimethylaminohydrolase family protein [Niallia sp. 03133]|uniref:dimethylarginine dimethylaminohydrolase family protein n=1 Tax=Niallia sp. 03133 TaxID=3458060 RepID=UPI0040448269